MLFNNHNPETNGEKLFYETYKNKFKVIFDVGCRSDSLFTTFTGEVHYFEPCQQYLEQLQLEKQNQNSQSFFNPFGLSDENKILSYYPNYQSFFDRIQSCGRSDEPNKILLQVKRADEYIHANNIQTIDFLKIDTEGYELKVLKGFGESLSIVKIIQFEYGGTFLDNNTKLSQVIDYLETFGFTGFSYLCPQGKVLLPDYNDHYQYCNIVCWNTLRS